MSLFRSQSNTRQAIWVGMGSLSSLCLSLVSAAILSRYLTKEDYGTYKQVLYVYHTLLAVFTLGLPRAFSFFLPRVSLEEGRDVVKKITNIFYLTGALFSILLLLFAPLIANILNNDNLSYALRIFSPVPFLMLPTMGIESIYSTYRKTYLSAMFVVISRMSILICIVLPVVIFAGDSSMALTGFVVSSFIVYLVATYLKNKPFRGLQNRVCHYTYKDIMKYSLPLMYAGIFGMGIGSVDQFFVSRYFGTEIFAEFSNGSMEIPLIGMIIGACSVVLSPLFSKYAHNNDDPRKEIVPLWCRVFEKTAMLTYPIVVFCWFYAEEIMNILYGVQYSNSATYFKISIIANIFTLVVYGPLLLALGKTKYYANVHMYGFIILVAAEYLSLLLFNSPYVITAVSVICRIGRIVAMILYISSLFKVSFWEMFPIKYVLKIIIPSAIILFLISNVVNLENDIFNILIGGFLFVICYFIWSYFAKLNYIKLLKSFIK